MDWTNLMMETKVRMLDLLQLEYFAVRCDINTCRVGAALAYIHSVLGQLNTMKNVRMLVLMYGLKILKTELKYLQILKPVASAFEFNVIIF